MTVTGRAAATGRRAARSGQLEVAARAGFVARGATYVLIGVIAVQTARGAPARGDP